MHVFPNHIQVGYFITFQGRVPSDVHVDSDVVGGLLPHPVQGVFSGPMVVALHVGCDEFQGAIGLVRDQTEFADFATCSTEQLKVNRANVVVAM